MTLKISKLDELKTFKNELVQYADSVIRFLEGVLTEKESKRGSKIYNTISKKVGYLGSFISELSDMANVDVQGKECNMWSIALKMPTDKLADSALGDCLLATNKAIGKLEDDIKKGVRDEQGNRIEKPSSIPTEPLKDTGEVPSYLFDKMQFHPKIINASRALFEDEHYAQAIFEAFKAVENFVKDKAGSSLYGKQLMSTAFNENNPLIQVPEAGHFDKDVQEGFKFLFMGATVGIRNPKAHKRIIQKDPFITLEYLGFASFLIKRIDY